MTIKQLKEQIKNLNDDVTIHIATPHHTGVKVKAEKFSKWGRDSNDEECLWLCLISEDARSPTGVENYKPQ